MKLHICNTFFEWELNRPTKISLEEAFNQHPVYQQLQFLPLLYKAPEDGILVTANPSNDPQLHLYGEDLPPYEGIVDWGASELIASWAKKQNIPYQAPPLSLVRKIHSKAYAHEKCPVKGSAIIYNEGELKQFIDRPLVLKSLLERSGRGHTIIHSSSPIVIKQPFPLLVEPWLERILDFSTQWTIDLDRSVTFLGTTICHNDARGRYLGSSVGMKNPPFLDEHLSVARPILEEIAQLGFFGHLGIDAFLYKEEGKTKLRPLVEINARKTMGYAALMAAKGRAITLNFSKENTKSLLPKEILKRDGTRVKFAFSCSIKIDGN